MLNFKKISTEPTHLKTGDFSADTIWVTNANGGLIYKNQLVLAYG